MIYRLEGQVDYEMVHLMTYSDANFAVLYSTGGRVLFWTEGRRSLMPSERRSKKQQISATSSGENDALEWGAAAKTTVKLASMLEKMTTRPVEAAGYVDNDAIRLAVARGSSHRRVWHTWASAAR